MFIELRKQFLRESTERLQKALFSSGVPFSLTVDESGLPEKAIADALEDTGRQYARYERLERDSARF